MRVALLVLVVAVGCGEKDPGSGSGSGSGSGVDKKAGLTKKRDRPWGSKAAVWLRFWKQMRFSDRHVFAAPKNALTSRMRSLLQGWDPRACPRRAYAGLSFDLLGLQRPKR